jgi:hypothetical protein
MPHFLSPVLELLNSYPPSANIGRMLPPTERREIESREREVASCHSQLTLKSGAVSVKTT